MLGEVDDRLGGLVLSVDVFRVIEGGGALVGVGVIGPDPTLGGASGATPGDLWALARQALTRDGIVHEPQSGIGQDAFLATYGQGTAQAAWVTGNRVATTSVA
jgi:hypothetical protein